MTGFRMARYSKMRVGKLTLVNEFSRFGIKPTLMEEMEAAISGRGLKP